MLRLAAMERAHGWVAKFSGQADGSWAEWRKDLSRCGEVRVRTPEGLVEGNNDRGNRTYWAVLQVLVRVLEPRCGGWDKHGFLVFNKGTAGDVIEAVLGWGWVRCNKNSVASDPEYKRIHRFATAELTEQEEQAVQDFRFVLEEAIMGLEVIFWLMADHGQTDEDIVRTLSSRF
jgi:hypothetical protein